MTIKAYLNGELHVFNLDGAGRLIDMTTGERYNEEFYSEDSYSTISFMLVQGGYQLA